MNHRIVLDASAAANIVVRTDVAEELIEKLEHCALVIAPGLFHSEIANTLWKYVRAGDIDTQTALFRYEEAISLIDTSGSRYFCESLFWASQPKQAAKT
jgi:predicted nucleic acid-binding protein